MRGEVAGKIAEWEGSLHTETLCVIHASGAQLGDDGVVLDELGDALQAQGMADVCDCPDHGRIHRFVQHVAHEGAIDLQIVDRQVLEVGERRQAAAKIVQS